MSIKKKNLKMSELPLVRGTNLLPDCQKGLLFFKSVLRVFVRTCFLSLRSRGYNTVLVVGIYLVYLSLDKNWPK